MTIPADEYASRREDVRTRMVDRGLDAVLVWGEPHGSLGLLGAPNDIGYLTEWPLRHPGSGAALLVLPHTGEPTLLVTGPKYAPAYATDRTGLTDVRRVEPTTMIEEAGRVLGDRTIEPGQLGIVRQETIPRWVADQLTDVFGADQLTDATELIRELRMTKSDTALTAIARAAAVCDAMFETLEGTITAGVDHHTVCTDLEAVAHDRGTEFVTTWIASGPLGGTYPVFEPTPGGRTVAAGDLVVVGIQLLNDNHWGHAIRAGVVGEPSDEQRRLYDIVAGIRRTILEEAAPGVDLADLHAAVQSCYADTDYEQCFRSLHGLGLQYGGPPAFPQSGADTTIPSLELQSGMVFEVHPNVWAGPNGAACLAVGDMAVVTDTGTERLTATPTRLLRW